MYDPKTQELYDGIQTFYNNPIFTKLQESVDQKYSCYFCKTDSSLGIYHRYLVCFVRRNNNEIGSTLKLNNIYWEAFHTRTLEENHKIPKHSYIPKRIPQLNKKITQRAKSDHYPLYTYDVEHYDSLKINLIGKDEFYQPTGNLLSALETFNTILTLK